MISPGIYNLKKQRLPYPSNGFSLVIPLMWVSILARLAKVMFDLGNSNFPKKIPIVPVYQDVLLPVGVVKLSINDDVREALTNEGVKLIGLIPSEVPIPEKKGQEYKEGDIGTIGALLSITTSNLPEFSSYIIVLGLSRFIVKKIFSTEPYCVAEIIIHHDNFGNIDAEAMAFLNKLKKIALPQFSRISALPLRFNFIAKRMLDKLPIPALFDFLFALSSAKYEEKLDILRTLNAASRLAKGIPILVETLDLPFNVDENRKGQKVLPTTGLPIIKIVRPSGSFVRDMKDIPEHEDKDITELTKKIQNAGLPEDSYKSVMKDVNRLKRLSHFSPDHAVLRNYLDFVADLPWSVSSKETLDVNRAREELEVEHYGLEKIKKRVLEYLAVCQLKSDLKGPILCFVGPPGVGKSSIGKSIAKILNKNFQRISLGGVSNSSEIRGHRRTYIGALPGRILQALKQAAMNNPVILLDEIDKLGQGVMGSPKDALLEVLDPEQNSHFTDHYLGMPFDLSNITFIATANSLNSIPIPLADRMEIIFVSGYTSVEKFNIAIRHLLPKQMSKHGLNSNSLQITDDAVHSIIRDYTKEAGVRKLEQKLAAICRTAALKIASSQVDTLPILIDKEDLEDILGVPLYMDDDLCGKPLKPGIAIGLGWTGHGGNAMIVEATRVPGGVGKLTLTGCLGHIMKESAQIALNWVRSVGHRYGLGDESCDLLGESDLHIHFPSGAVSKEGPSAGITIACAILSLFTGVPLVSGLAMTGELTLQGRVLAVGGLNEKLAAASRLGIKKVIIPFKSRKFLNDISECLLANLEIILVENMTEVIESAFDGGLVARPNSDSVLCSKM